MGKTTPPQPDLLPCEVPEVLPVLGIKSTVVFPHAVGSVQLALPENLAVLDAYPGEDEPVAASALVDPEKPLVAENFTRISVAARVLQRLRMTDGTVRIVLQGLQRVRLEEFLSSDPYFRARVSCPPEGTSGGEEEARLVGRALETVSRLSSLDGRYPEEIVKVLKLNLEDPARFADLVPTLIPFPYDDRRRLVETLEVSARLALIVELLEREVERARVGKEIEGKTTGAISKAQREAYLREEIRVIRRELGDEDPLEAEAAELEAKIEAAKLPEEAREEALRGTQRLRTVGTGSPEATIIRHHLEWLLALPWNEASEEAIDVEKVRKVLERNHHGLARVKERIVEILSVAKLTGGSRGMRLCFVGPPGTGKTSLGRSIAEALGRRYVRISVGGVHDESEIRGHRRTYVGAMPGKILQAMRRAGSRNPVLVIDEVDKMSPGPQGDPSAALLEVLDPEQNAFFTDHFLGVPFDLSRVLFVATANAEHEIPEPLLDRMEVLPLSAYTDREKVEIGRRYLLPKILEEHGLSPKDLRVPDATIRAIVRSWAREAGIRHLRQGLERIARHVAVEVAGGKRGPRIVGERALQRYLGPPRFVEEEALRGAEVGVATGLAWTPDGGALLLIEALRMPGSGRTVVTGSLGDVMRESVEAASSFVRSRAASLGIATDALPSTDIHVHFPAGAIPKDGPSAGIAIASALASLLSERPVRPGLAMTGEITLRGKVLPVGGLKEKVLAARRAGIQEVVLPASNRADLSEVPLEVRSKMRFHLVGRVDEVLRLALSRPTLLRPATPDGGAARSTMRRIARPPVPRRRVQR